MAMTSSQRIIAFLHRHVWVNYSLLWWDTVKRWSVHTAILQVADVLATDYSAHRWASPDGRRATFKLFPADLSFTQSSLSMLTGLTPFAAFKRSGILGIHDVSE